MFENLKAKLKGFVNIFSKKVEEEAKDVQEPVKPPIKKEVKRESPEKPVRELEKPKEEKPVEKKPRESAEKKREEPIEIKSEPKDEGKPGKEPSREIEQEPPSRKKPVEEHKKGFIESIKERLVPSEQKPEEKKGIAELISDRINKKVLTKGQFEEIFSELEMMLLENNVAVEVIDKIKHDLEANIVDKPLPRNQISEIIRKSLANTIESLFDVQNIDISSLARKKKPLVVLFLGINGSGKTTTIAKIAHLLLQNHLKVVVAAGDTFRAAAIQQLEQHTNKLNIKLIKHDYGADAAAVAFDAIKYAEARKIDVVLIDTAGRLHSNVNLMDELKKIARVAKPDLKVFVGESITGNDCVEQARTFNESIGIDGIILSKADVDEKGGAAISVSYITRKPILYLGTGQDYSDLKPFDPGEIVKALGLST